jgi:hypothetical protein
MVRYSEELIEDIKNSNDIVDIISQYVILKRSGRNFFGLCPFHKEKTSSFSVSPDKQIFHCFGCGVGGNVIHFISKIENVDFKESLEMLAERAGIKLPTLEGSIDNKRQELGIQKYASIPHGEWRVAVIDLSLCESYACDSNDTINIMLRVGGSPANYVVDVAYAAVVDSLDEVKYLVGEDETYYDYGGDFSSAGVEKNANQ